MKRIIYTLLLLYIVLFNTSAQKSVGEWSTYLAYYTTTKIAEANNHVYAVADGSLYSYNKEDNSITHYSKQTGLSDSDINFIIFNPEVNTLLITYSNGNIDLLSDSGIYNLSYLLDNSNITDKTINNIYLNKELAYLSTNFGIIVLNMVKKEIKDTYKLNKKVYSVVIDTDHIYAATAAGLIFASLDSNLLDYNEWKNYTLSSSEFGTESIRQIGLFKNNLCFLADPSDKSKTGIYYQESNGTVKNLLKNRDLKQMVIQNNKLITYTYSELYIYSSFTDRDVVNAVVINDIASLKDPNTFWIASGTSGIKGIRKNNNQYEIILENTNDNTKYPKRNYNYFMTMHENKLLVAGGGRGTDRWGRAGTLMEYEDGKWYNFNENEVNNKFRRVRDYTGIAVDPKDPEHYFISSYGEGIVEIKNNEVVQLYDHTNSALTPITYIPGLNPLDYVRIGGVTFDKEGNLWATNCEVTDALKVLKTDGTWASFGFSDFTNAHKVDKITITSNNRKWINADEGILIFDDKGTIDDKSDDESHLYETFSDTNGTIDASGYYCVTEDKNGHVWIGTSRGPIVCTNPGNNINNISASRIVRTNDNGEPYYLLDGEKINAIAVDGGNRKWIATNSSGVFLVSEDGMETISNFTTANSPLPSNQINSLTINQFTGEVFIGTEKGLVSYITDATEGNEDYSDIYAYPNPVRPEHNDRVTIVGLMNDSNVKITDIRGNIIYQGKSAGGTFTWDCRKRGGSRVATGIYLVLAATPEAKESVVTKIMVVK